MKIKNVKSWDHFIEKLDHLKKIRNSLVAETPASVSEIIFRGQPNWKWRLQTTLERLACENVGLSDYYAIVSFIKPKIESVTGKIWPIPSREKFKQWCDQQKSALILPFQPFPAYEYLAYLRHHGFPSPLLDWTKSPYIAAYFAMTPQPIAKKASIFAFIEYVGTKVCDINGPVIQTAGPLVRTHKRHYLQQSRYTICTQGQGLSLSYANHERVILQKSGRQDLLWRIDIPITERKVFLTNLEVMNINSFSLFETEDKLMEHLYISEVLSSNMDKLKIN
jgi:hypothetical protein